MLHGLVTKPDLDDVGENAKRRALLFIRYLSLWSELPKGTEWFEVDVRAVRPGPDSSVSASTMAEARPGQFHRAGSCRTNPHASTVTNVVEDAFLTKIAALRDWLRLDIDPGAVLLIGLSESQPLTILDGNHRLVAATLTSPESLHKFRFLVRTFAQDDGMLLVPNQCRDTFSVWYKSANARYT